MLTDMTDLGGILPPVPTPLGKDDEVNLAALAANLEWLNHFDLSGIVVLGSNGEAVLLEEQEKLRLVASARAGMSEDRLLVVGTGLQSTRSTIAFTRAAASAGADYALVLPPFYYRALMTDDALHNHFQAVADASPIPIILYNMPSCTGLDLSAQLIVSLSAHERIVGLKDSGGNVAKLAQIHGTCERQFRIFAGSAGFLLPALSVGAVGGVLALANIAPGQCLDLVRLALSGDIESARAIQLNLIAVNDAVTRRWGIPALKAAMDMLGLCGGAVRLPLLPLGSAERGELQSLLIEARILNPEQKETMR